MNLENFGKIILIFGFVLIIIGGIFIIFGRIPFFGKLPGDIYIKKENFVFYFPITTAILISLILTLILNIIGKIK